MTYVSEQHRHRKTMHQLQGICRTLAVQIRDGLSPPDAARVASVQAGAFLFNSAHSRYDMSAIVHIAGCPTQLSIGFAIAPSTAIYGAHISGFVTSGLPFLIR